MPPSKASRGSPPETPKTREEIQQYRQPPGWCLHEIHCEGNLLVTVIQIANSTVPQDAYFQPLSDTLANREPTY